MQTIQQVRLPSDDTNESLYSAVHALAQCHIFFSLAFQKEPELFKGIKKNKQTRLKTKETKTKTLVSESHAWPRTHLVTFVGTRLDNTGGR